MNLLREKLLNTLKSNDINIRTPPRGHVIPWCAQKSTFPERTTEAILKRFHQIDTRQVLAVSVLFLMYFTYR